MFNYSKYSNLALLLFVIIVTVGTSISAFASVRVMPTRVFLNDKARVARLSVRNDSKEEKTFVIKPVFYRMSPNGSMSQVAEATEEERSAEELIRYSPKRVTLKAGEEQIVRVLLRRKKDLAEGDYRIHLYFSEDPSLAESEDPIKQSAPAMELKAIVAVAIPVIYTRGSGDYKVSLKNLQLKKGAKDQDDYFIVDMILGGKGFAYGELSLHFQPDGSKEETRVFFIRGVSSYIPERSIRYPLKDLPLKLKNGHLRVEFKDSEDRTGQVLANLKVKI